jgi:hypothetical protein
LPVKSFAASRTVANSSTKPTTHTIFFILGSLGKLPGICYASCIRSGNLLGSHALLGLGAAPARHLCFHLIISSLRPLLSRRRALYQ